MEYLLDTAHLESIEKYLQYFPVSGVTSNPTIVKKEGKIDFFSHMNTIRKMIGKSRSLHIQVSAKDHEGMMKDADAILNRVDADVYIKVPVTMEGLKTIQALKSRGVRVTGTAVYTKTQGLIAMEAGADYLAPYFNRIENNDGDPEEVISSFADMIAEYGYPTKILAASFKNAGQIDRAFLAGAQAATFDPAIMESALSQAVILSAVDQFGQDWKSVFGEKNISEI